MPGLGEAYNDPYAMPCFVDDGLLVDGHKKALFSVFRYSEPKKYLSYPMRQLTEYTDQDVADCLATPAGYTDATIFDGNASDRGLISDSGMELSSWGWYRQTDDWGEHGVRMNLDYIIAERRAYKGPIYNQGPHPTCGAWASIHALLAGGITLSTAVAKDLLNGALPREHAKEGGLNGFDAAGIVRGHYDGDVVVDMPALGLRPLTRSRVAGFIKDTIDASGAVVAVVKTSDRRPRATTHALCVAGYNINEEGAMALQVIDSAIGAGALTLDGLMVELAVAKSLVPLAGVRRV